MHKSCAKCVCQDTGDIHSGIPGILISLADAAGNRVVERCDACQRYYSDESACMAYSTLIGGRALYDKKGRAMWCAQ